MSNVFAKRMETVQRSFIREILKVTDDPNIISFGGGLPNPKTFPVEQVAEAARKVFAESGPNALQYSATEGSLPSKGLICTPILWRSELYINICKIMIWMRIFK